MNSCTPTDSEKCVIIFSTDMLNTLISYGMQYFICLYMRVWCLFSIWNMPLQDTMTSLDDLIKTKRNKAEILFRGFPKLH